ncbi:carbohydrate-binding-like protein [Lyophyllum atratum]|nr:carbohydrate-binding-like protein [Lyophyllum atratum]
MTHSSYERSITVNILSQPFFTNLIPGTPVGTYKVNSATFKTIVTAASEYADSFVGQQFSKGEGSPTGAEDYSWSYAALLTFRALGMGRRRRGAGEEDVTVTISFNVQANTVFGENIYLVGSTGALGNWSPDNALLLNAHSYPPGMLPASEVEYKYISKHDGDVIWEIDPSRHFTTPGSGQSSLFDKTSISFGPSIR